MHLAPIERWLPSKFGRGPKGKRLKERERERERKRGSEGAREGWPGSGRITTTVVVVIVVIR